MIVIIARDLILTKYLFKPFQSIQPYVALGLNYAVYLGSSTYANWGKFWGEMIQWIN